MEEELRWIDSKSEPLRVFSLAINVWRWKKSHFFYSAPRSIFIGRAAQWKKLRALILSPAQPTIDSAWDGHKTNRINYKGLWSLIAIIITANKRLQPLWWKITSLYATGLAARLYGCPVYSPDDPPFPPLDPRSSWAFWGAVARKRNSLQRSNPIYTIFEYNRHLRFKRIQLDLNLLQLINVSRVRSRAGSRCLIDKRQETGCATDICWYRWSRNL